MRNQSPAVEDTYMQVVPRKHARCSSDSEAFASEFLEILSTQYTDILRNHVMDYFSMAVT